MSRFARTASKYRHINGSLFKKELWYPDLKPTNSTGDFNSIAASVNWLAIAWASAGQVALLGIHESGKRKTNDLQMISAHTGDITDIQFSPFNDNLLCTAGDDGTVKLWSIPTDSRDNLNTPAVTLAGHKRRAECVQFHPTADNIVVTGGADKTVRVWDVTAGRDAIVLDGIHGDAVTSVSWNYNGSLLATASKDKKLRVIDIRANQVVQQGDGHQGVKSSRVVWLGNSNKLATSGFSKARDRQFGVWDATNLSKSLALTNLDSSTGVLDLYYDGDTSLLYLAGKGDGSIRVYEMDLEKAPYYQEIHVVQSDFSQKSTAFLPKRGVDLMGTEVARIFRLTNNAVAPVGFSVPRKSKSDFQEDLYPPTPSTQPALSASEWLAGENRDPNLFQLRPSTNPRWWEENNTPAAAPSSSSSSTSSTPASSYPPTPANTPAPSATSSPSTAAARSTSSSSSSSSPSSSSSRSSGRFDTSGVEEQMKQVQVVRSSKFRHIVGKGTKIEDCYTALRTVSSGNTSVIRGNSKFFAVPWEGTGGRVAIIPLARKGRQSDKLPCLECGSDCLDFDWNPFNDHVFAAVTESAHLQIWNIPQEGITQNVRSADQVLKGHTRRVTTVDFHPTAANLVATSSSDLTVRLWDIEKASEGLCVEGHNDIVLNLSWNYDASLLVTACKDKEIRILDPRSSQKIVSRTVGIDGAKGFKVCWVGNKQQLLAVGHSKTSERQLALFDARNLGQPINTVAIDQSSGLITPYYDMDTGVVFLCGKGDGNIKMYEVNEEAPYVHYLTDYSSTTPANGIALLPKTMCDVRNCEIATFLKLTNDYVEQLHFTVPRTRMEFFQDDLFPPTRNTAQPVLTAAQWFSGQTKEPALINLQPSGMQKLSEAPVEKKEKKYDFRTEVAKEENRFTKEKFLGSYYNQMNQKKEEEAQVLKQDMMQGVADDEWDD